MKERENKEEKEEEEDKKKTVCVWNIDGMGMTYLIFLFLSKLQAPCHLNLLIEFNVAKSSWSTVSNGGFLDRLSSFFHQ